MADPLSQLRQFHRDRKEIKEINGYIVFGDHGWPKKVNTNYQVYSSDGDKNKKEYYTLECLLYFLRHIGVAHHHYVKQGGALNIPVVHRPDRKHLLDYLNGDSPTSIGIDKNAPIPNGLRLPLSEILKKSNAQSSTSEPKFNAGQQSTQHQSIGDDLSGPTIAKRRPPNIEETEKFRKELQDRLNENRREVVTLIPTEGVIGETAETSAAISKFGPEKLAAMRAKHLATKRKTIIDADVERSGSTTADPSTNQHAEMMIAIDSDHSRLIKSKEKVWRTRSTILQAQSKDFSKTVLPLVEMLFRLDDPNRRSQTNPGAPSQDMQMNNSYHQHPSQHIQSNNQQSIQRNAYNRYDQERFVKLDIGVEIDTKKSFVSGVANGLSRAQQPASKPSQPVQVSGQIRADHVNSYGRSTSASHVHNHLQQHSRHYSQRPSVHHSQKPSKLIPIIIIPATNTSLINMYNALHILQDLTFVEGLPNKARDSEILIQRKKPDGTSAIYKILDNPLKLDPDDWSRVVAVFVQGPAWQFKGWPWGGSPVEIFSRIKGFHLKWDESKLDENVAKWNVHILELSRNKRHLDKANLLKFWSSLDQFMAKHKSFLKF